MYVLVYNWSWYVSVWAGIDYSALNRDLYPNLFFVKSPCYSLFFYSKEGLKLKYCKSVKITIVRLSHIYWSHNFFCIHRNLWWFSPFGQFFGLNSSQKKNRYIWKDIFIFFSDSWVFFWNSRKMPTKKKRYHTKKKYHFRHSAFFSYRA